MPKINGPKIKPTRPKTTGPVKNPIKNNKGWISEYLPANLGLIKTSLELSTTPNAKTKTALT